jgi:hypothetical protein
MKHFNSWQQYVFAAVIAMICITSNAANITWTNTSSGSWSTAANWNPNSAPGATDTAIITNAGVNVTLDVSPTVGGIILGTNGAGTVTLSIAGQTLTLNGPLTVNPSGSFTVDSGTLVGNTNAVLHGTIGWSAGALAGIWTLATGSSLNLTTANNHDLNGMVLTNNGTVTWSDGRIRTGNGTTICNNGLWTALNDQNVGDDFGGATTVFNNYGTFRKSGGTSEFATATIFVNGVAFNQLAGVLDVQNGTNGLEVAFQGGGNFTGGYITTNQFGLTVLSAGNFNLNGTVTGTNTWEDAGNLAGTNVIQGALTWVGGNWNPSYFVTIATNSTLFVAGGGNNLDFNGVIVTNNGIVKWSSGTLRSGNAGAIYNYGLFDCQSDQQLNNAYGGAGTTFNNYGTLRKSGGASEISTATIYAGGVLFNQLGGVIDVQNGTNGLELALEGGGNLTGGYITTNQFGLTVLGNSQAYNVNGTVTGTNTWLQGNLTGTNVIKSGLTWVSGNWNPSYFVTIATNSLLIVNGGIGNNMDLNGVIVTNNGTVLWASGILRSGNGGTVNNYGTWNCQSDQTFNNAYGGAGTTFNNYGTFIKSGNSGTTLLDSGVAFNNTGAVNVLNGTLDFNGGGTSTGGTYSEASGAFLDFNNITFATSTTIVGTNLVTLSGTINVNGVLTGQNLQFVSGTLGGSVVIAGALTWSGGALSGTLTVATNSSLVIAGGGGNNDMNGVILTNNGTVSWSSGTLRSGNAGAVYNYGLWDCQSDQTINQAFGGTGVTFNNYGTFRKSGGASEFSNATIFGGNIFFNQLAGVIDVQNGTNGLELAFQGGANLNGGYITTNQFGLTVLSIGTFNINGTVTGTNTWDDTGTLAGTNVIQGALTWVGGDWSPSFFVTIATNSTLLIAGGGNDMNFNGVIITNNGTVKWSSGTLRSGNAGGIYNYGLFDCQSDQTYNQAYGGAAAFFNNYGTLRKSGGASEFSTATFFGGNVIFNQLAGVIDVQNGTNGLELALQGGGNLNGGYITTNQFGLTVLSIGNFNVNGTVTGTNTWENNGNLAGDNVIHGALTWVGGSWSPANSVTIANNSTVLMIGGGGNMTMYGVLVTNYGTFTWSSGYPDGGGSPGTVVYNYGLWDCQSDYNFKDDAGGAGTIINNYGTFRKSAGTNASQTIIQSGVLFNQLSGIVDVKQGNFVLSGGGNFTGGTATNNNGTLWFSAGNFNLNGTLTGTNVIENAGNLVGNNVVQGTLQWQAGQWTPANSVTIANNSTVNIAGGTGNMNMYSLPVTNYGTVTWSSGYPDGGGTPATLIYNYGLWDCQSDYNFKDDAGGNGTIINNYGTFRKSVGTNASQTLIQGGVLFNQISGAVDVRQGNLTLQGGGNFTGGTATNNSGALYLNYGSFNLNGTLTGTNVIENNSGNLVGNNVIQGTLQWWAGQWNPATSVTIASNSLVNIAGGSGNMYMYSLPVTNYGTVAWSSGYPDGGGTPATQIYNYGLWDCQSDYNFKDDAGGNGTIINNYGTFRKSAGTNASQTLLQSGIFFNQASGVVDVQQGNLVMSGGGNLSGGYFTTNNTGLAWLSSGSFNINGTVTTTNVIENPGNLIGTNVIQGGLTWQAGYWYTANSVTIASNSTVIMAGGSGNLYIYDLPITNYGTVTWSSGYPDGGGNPATLIYNYGLWDCQSDYAFKNDNGGLGTLINNYGTFRKSSGSDASQTTLPAATSINNYGKIDSQAGWLVFQGGYTLTNGTVNFGLNSRTNYGKISLSGAATLTGTVSANLNNGYIPINGNSFTNLYYGSFSSSFTNTVLPFADAWTTNYLPTYLVFTVLNARPVLAPLATNSFVVNELTALSVTNTATDLNIPTETITYSLASGLPGMTVNSATGLFAWTPPQTNSPSTNVVSVSVVNNGVPPLSATNTFTVIVKEVNVPASLPTISTQIVNELTLLTVTNSATNFNIHSTITGYGLVNAPTGMSISAAGIITWTPTQLQSPGTNLITTIVTNSNPYDAVNPKLTSTNSFTVIVKEVNVPASLPTISTQIVNELTLLTVTNSATNGNIHSTITGYALVSPLAGMSISAGGIFTWTPTQAQSPGTNLITTIVTNSNPYDLVNPKLTATNSFTVIVKEINIAPTLPTVVTQIVNELTLLTVTNTATNLNIHATAGYVLTSFPAGMTISSGGIITWTPSSSESPSTNQVTTVVTNTDPYDLVNPHLSATNTFYVVVKEVNVAPSLPTIATQIVNELTMLTVTNTATNGNVHATITGYTLVSPPAGLVISSSGMITWTPTQAESPGTNLITTIVTNSDPYDLVSPKLTATNTFTVIVKEVNQPPVLPVIGTQTLTLLQLFSIANGATEPNIHSTTGSYVLVSPPIGASINASGLITWTPVASQTLTTNTITTVVTNSNPYDLVNPHLSTTNSFLAVILPNTSRTNITALNLNGTNLDLSWPADHTGWRLQNQTNTLAKGLGTNWIAVSGSAATNHLVIPVTRTNGVVVFRMIYP